MPTLPYGGDARESRRPTSAFIETRCPNARAFQAERETYLVEPFVTVANWFLKMVQEAIVALATVGDGGVNFFMQLMKYLILQKSSMCDFL